MKRRSILTIAFLLVTVFGYSAANAQDQWLSNFYVTGYGTVNFADAEAVPFGNNLAVDPDFTTPFEGGTGGGWGVGLGKRLSNNFRVEARVSGRQANVDDTNIGTGARSGFDYNVQFESEVIATTLELFYDFQRGGKVTPYIKGGLGAAFAESSATIDSGTDPLFTNVLGPAGFLNDEGRYPYEANDQSSFAWNAGVGVNVKLTNRLSLMTEYQYMFIGDVATQIDPFTDGFKVDDFGLHEINIGLSICF